VKFFMNIDHGCTYKFCLNIGYMSITSMKMVQNFVSVKFNVIRFCNRDSYS
jgi:hypothetical protein